ncbi:MAG: aminoacyltransferase [Erysipelotrichaceae bacterium]|nr:aminoacyltransferase [Erysipelotrichaceae bacterium]
MEYINLNKTEFDKYAKNHALNSIFQNSSWANTKSNWKPLYVGVKKDGNIIGGALVLLRRLPLNFTFAYIPRGPLLDYSDEQLCGFFFKNLKKQLLKEKVLLCKIDPNIVIDEIDFKDKELITNIKNDELVNQLKQYGLKHLGYTLLIKDTIQPRIQLELLTEDYENTIPKKTMKKIRNSYNKGVVIVNEKSNVESLTKMIEFTKTRHNINLRNNEYFKNLINSFEEDACVLSAYLQDQLVSSCLLVKSKNTTEILYSGYDDEYKHCNSTYPLRYEAIKWAKDHGCKYFNFGGVEGTLDDGLTVFKSSFNPKIKIYIGEFNLYTIPLISNIFELLFKKYK